MNILSTFADKTSNDALFIDAQTAVNQHDWNGALSKIGSMTGAFATTPDVLRLKASAYGGLCGFDFLTFVQQLSGMGATFLFPFLLSSFDASVATNIDACKSAHDTLISIGAITDRSVSDNFEIAMLAFAKIGNILSYYGDKAKAGSSANSFDPCTAGTDRVTPGDLITDLDAREIGSGLSLAVINLTAVAGHVTVGGSQLGAISGVCSALPAGFNFCAVTDPAAFTANEVRGIRTLLNESTVVGLGGPGKHCTGDVTVCACP